MLPAGPVVLLLRMPRPGLAPTAGVAAGRTTADAARGCLAASLGVEALYRAMTTAFAVPEPAAVVSRHRYTPALADAASHVTE